MDGREEKIDLIRIKVRMNIFIRVDSSINMGTGHLMRCLTLADSLQKKGGVVSFICRLLPGNICHVIEKKGYKLYRLPYTSSECSDRLKLSPHENWLDVEWWTDVNETIAVLQNTGQFVDWLVVDHYSLDYNWEKSVRPYVQKIMVIDDLADRSHDCDLLLDQNLYNNMETRYEGLVPAHCQKLLGPSYALLRPEFIKARENLRKRNGTIQRILVFFGGSDPTNETAKALEAVYLLNHPQLAVDVVVGSANPHKEKIKKLCLTIPNTTYHCQVENMAELISRADLAIGAGGSASWERCCLGLPSLVVILADNQCELVNNLAEQGAIINLGWAKNLTAIDYLEAIDKLISIQMKKLTRECSKLVDGKGCKRVVNHVFT